MPLSATRVKALKEPGRYSDGGGLHLFISKSKRKSWVLRITIDGRRRDIGLGGYPAVTLANAREKAYRHRAAIADGRDPLVEKLAPAMQTFKEAAYKFHKENEPRWNNAKHTANWIQSLERHAFPKLGNIPLDRIERSHVLGVLKPIWNDIPEAARRVRQRMRAIFAWAISSGFMESNPAGDVINAALPRLPKVKNHFRALAYQDVGFALDKVEASQGSLAAKLCLRFLVLTAARSGQARGATWDEIELEDQLWRIPSQRMKTDKDHRVPLCRQALELLQEVHSLRDESGLVFPSPQKRNARLSDMTLLKLLRSIGVGNRPTVHGFRSSFKDWTLEQTNLPWAVSEAALAHKLGNSTEQAYARSDLFERRRVLMQSWADYVIR